MVTSNSSTVHWAQVHIQARTESFQKDICCRTMCLTVAWMVESLYFFVTWIESLCWLSRISPQRNNPACLSWLDPCFSLWIMNQRCAERKKERKKERVREWKEKEWEKDIEWWGERILMRKEDLYEGMGNRLWINMKLPKNKAPYRLFQGVKDFKQD